MCNDYSQQTANTGLANLDDANPYLDGSGSIFFVLSAGESGTTIRSVTIKAAMPVTQGMVRLFIYSGTRKTYFLYKEVPIPIQPQAPSVPLPAPQYIMFETKLVGDLKLQAGDELYASTQNAESFNIIAEGVDWAYLGALPPVCCSFIQEVAAVGAAVISVANPYLYNAGTIVNVYTADPSLNGATIKTVTIKALQNTHEGAVRLFISPDGGDGWLLMQEIWIPETTQSAYEPSFKRVLDMDFKLAPGYSIGASTQNAESFAITLEAVNWQYVPPDPLIYSRSLTIDHTQCGSSDSSNFPVLVSIQDDTLKTVAHIGGHVANSSGYDIMFFSDSGETSLLNWEVELYDGIAGTLVAWVSLPAVSSSSDTVFYMQYGNASITSFQGGAAGIVWANDGNYQGVWHLPDGATLTTNDATTNGNDGAISGAVAAVAGQIDGGASFDADVATYIGISETGSTLSPTIGSITMSAWFLTSSGGVQAIMGHGTSTPQAWVMYVSGFKLDQAQAGGLGSGALSTTDTVFTPGEWAYATCIWTFGSTMKIYLNGVLKFTNSAYTALPTYSGLPVWLGGEYGETTPWNGSLDELRFSTIERSADWIITEYNNQYAPGNIGTPGFITYSAET